jgi:hypothetical protein
MGFCCSCLCYARLDPKRAAEKSQITAFSLKVCGKKATTAASQHAAGVSALELWPVSTIMNPNGIVALELY